MWSQNPDQIIQNSLIGNKANQTNILHTFGDLYKKGPFKTLGELDEREMKLYMTKPLFEKISNVTLIANDYVIAQATRENFVTRDIPPPFSWPDVIKEEEEKIAWTTVLLKDPKYPDIEPAWHAWLPWILKFSAYTPQKIK